MLIPTIRSALLSAVVAVFFVAAPVIGQAQTGGFFTLTGDEAADYAPPSDTTLIRSIPMERFGLTYERYQQTYGGAEVLGGQVTVHRDDDGNVVRVIGAYYPYIAATNTVRITAAGAHGLVDRDIGPDGERDVSLMIDPDSGEFFWRVETRRAASRWEHWIGAESGVTLNKFDALTNQTCTSGSGNGVEFDRGVAPNALDDIKVLDCLITPTTGSGTKLVTAGGRQETHNQGSTRKPFLGPIATNNDNGWDTPGRESPGTGALVDAHYYMALADSYFRNLYQFNFTDASHYNRNIVIHGHYTKNYVNAFWNGTYFAFGDGDGVKYDPLTSLDVAAHEFTHSVTERFSNLIYQGESGALNESFSDIMAAVIEHEVDADSLPAGVSPSDEPDPDLRVAGSEWLIGEDFDLRPGQNGFRNMANPTEDGDRDNYANLYTGTSDNGGVHTNSGISNHAFYWLVEAKCGSHHSSCTDGTGVPIQRAGDIFFRGFTALPANATFCDARDATIASGETPEEMGKITAAWDHVGVDATLCGGGVTGNIAPTADFSVSCSNLECSFTDKSTDDSGISSWLWNFGDSSSSNVQAPPNHTYAAGGTYTVSLTVTDNASSPLSNTATRNVTVSAPGAGLTLNSIYPNSYNVNTDPPEIPVLISGSGFGPGPGGVTVSFQNGSGSTPVVSVANVTDKEIEIKVSALLKGKKGSIVWDVVVTKSNGSSATLPRAFTVIR